jgi:hypothetical protein
MGDAHGDKKGSGDDEMKEPEWMVKKREFEKVKARAKALKLRLTCTICGEKAKLNCPCGTTQYCSVACQKVDWRERGHRKVCKEIRARAEAPAPPPSPPREVFYGPAPRSHADEIRARIAAEHEAARARREANPESEPQSARWGSRCPICMEEWDVNEIPTCLICCCRTICASCAHSRPFDACPLCRMPVAQTDAEDLALLRRHVENEVPEAVGLLGDAYAHGNYGIAINMKKAVKIYKRGVELGNVDSMINLGLSYDHGDGGLKLDKKKAMQLYRMAANRGNARARYNLAYNMQAEGKFEECVALLRAAAAQGHTQAMHGLGVRYILGQGVEKDAREARRLWMLAAAKGCASSMTNLGKLYNNGAGVEPDLDEALRWYKRAAAVGDEGAIAELRKLEDAGYRGPAH